jgi:hypothetical protein
MLNSIVAGGTDQGSKSLSYYLTCTATTATTGTFLADMASPLASLKTSASDAAGVATTITNSLPAACATYLKADSAFSTGNSTLVTGLNSGVYALSLVIEDALSCTGVKNLFECVRVLTAPRPSRHNEGQNPD